MSKKIAQKAINPPLQYRASDPLPVMEQFYTLQGEGRWTGTAAWFIRLAGCDVGCVWCDVKDSWHPRESQYQPVSQIVAQALASGTEHVVVTGGEPTVYDLTNLTRALADAGLQVHLETAGPHPYSGAFDWVCFSPKKFLPPREEYYEVAHELKIVVYHEHDLKWAEDHAARCADHVQFFLQPEWSRRERITPQLVQYVKDHPHWRLSLQTHKFIEIP